MAVNGQNPIIYGRYCLNIVLFRLSQPVILADGMLPEQAIAWIVYFDGNVRSSINIADLQTEQLNICPNIWSNMIYIDVKRRFECNP